jgi:hypothetical protein
VAFSITGGTSCARDGGEMAVTQEARHQLYKALEAQLGEHNATTLIEHLPPSGWADVATKRDLHIFRTEVELAIERTARHSMQVFVTWMIAANAAMAAAIITAVKLT